MEYLVGVILSLATAGFAKITGFDRDRAFYPTVVIVVATYYVLFAAMGASSRTLIMEIAFATVFVALAVFGFKRTTWLVAAALVAHGVFDFIRPAFIHNPGVPRWWPGFCAAYDVPLGAMLAVLLMRRRQVAAPSASD